MSIQKISGNCRDAKQNLKTGSKQEKAVKTEIRPRSCQYIDNSLDTYDNAANIDACVEYEGEFAHASLISDYRESVTVPSQRRLGISMEWPEPSP